ncbi:hypothetical protein [Aeromonas allosaccharophila]|uniref:hypothetical protein n=1 Tax=Aeromonas allosaccharophila TaxID=656 RepID=UPI0013A6F729|nr:hypothetical protein [Aeromonas allosaccharophila]
MRGSIIFSLSEIKKNNTLYLLSKGSPKDYSTVYGEENLTSIIASNLRCIFKHNRKITIHCEAMVGNGRSDIKVDMFSKEICLVESKLIGPKSDVKLETQRAIEQLYNRYSENNTIEGNNGIELYLIKFTYDKEFRALIKDIKNAIHTYGTRNNLEYRKLSMSECGLDFMYIEKRSEWDFSDKERKINVLVSNMEVDHKKRSSERTVNKNYFLSGK